MYPLALAARHWLDDVKCCRILGFLLLRSLHPKPVIILGEYPRFGKELILLRMFDPHRVKILKQTIFSSHLCRIRKMIHPLIRPQPIHSLLSHISISPNHIHQLPMIYNHLMNKYFISPSPTNQIILLPPTAPTETPCDTIS